MPDPKTLNLVHEDGSAITVPVEEAAGLLASKRYHVEGDADIANRTLEAANEERYGGVGGAVKSTLAGAARTATGGFSDVAVRVLGGEDAAREAAGLRKHNPLPSLVGEVGGAFLPGGVAKLAERAGVAVAGTGGGAAAQLVRGGVAGGVEGGIQGVGSAVSELALSDDPLTMERIAAAMKSNVMFGGGAGAVAGVAAKGLGLGLSRAKRALDDVANTRQVGQLGEVPDDISKLDRKGLRAAEKAEYEAIEVARVTKRAELADEIRAFRQEQKANKLFLATKEAEDAEVRALAARSAKADKQIRNLIDNPKRLAKKPEFAEAALQQQESALEELVTKHGDNLRAKFAGDASGDRLKALEYASTALEKNRALQAKISELAAKPASQRLDDIAAAVDNLSAPKPSGGLAGDLLGGSVFGHVAGAFSGLPVIGPMIGAKAAGLVQKLVGGKLGAAAAEGAARGSKAIGAFLDVTNKVAPYAPVVASKVLTGVRYSQAQAEKKEAKRGKAKKEPAPTLAQAYRARASEVREAVEPTPDGGVQMRQSTRQQIADRLSPIRAAHPVMADRLETIAAKRVEFLASKLPRKPDLPGLDIGPDTWQPSDMEMRAWARYVAAVEDPHGVVERLADGTVTPEDAETMREVYPQMYADVQRQIMMQLGELRSRLPYQRRLALSIFSGVAVDPALDPRILGVLQASFAQETGTEGGSMAPRAQPAFGSVSKPEPTPAQERGA